MDEKNKKLKFVRIPKFEEVPYPIIMEPNLVIEILFKIIVLIKDLLKNI